MPEQYFFCPNKKSFLLGRIAIYRIVININWERERERERESFVNVTDDYTCIKGFSVQCIYEHASMTPIFTELNLPITQINTIFFHNLHDYAIQRLKGALLSYLIYLIFNK